MRSNDGFVIAEEDLRIRGPGEFFGFRQWGMPEFRVANMVRDGDILHQAGVLAALPGQDWYARAWSALRGRPPGSRPPGRALAAAAPRQ